MAEIVIYVTPPARILHPPPDALERVDWICLVLQPAMLGAGDHRQRVADVQFADEIEMKFETGNFKLRRCCVVEVERMDRVAFAEAEALLRAMRDVQQRRETSLVAVAEQQAVAADQPDEMREGFFDGVQVVEYVGVIEFYC